jgi:hypothetical protein
MDASLDALPLQRTVPSHRLMTCIVLVLGTVNIFFGEIVPAGGGFGWDGLTYANIVRALPSMIADGQMTSYYAQRLLPSAVVRVMLLASNESFSNENIIRAFEIYNLGLLLAGTYAWKRIADHLSLDISARWIGFGGIFVNFLITKQVMYSPVSTDVTAVFVSLLLLLFYLEKRPAFLFLTTVAGSFAWQISGLCGAMLIVLMDQKFSRDDIAAPSLLAKHRKQMAIGWLVLLVVSIIGYLASVHFLPANDRLQRLVTGAPSLAAVAIAITILIGSTQIIRSFVVNLPSIRPLLVVYAAAGIFIPRAIVKAISNSALPNPNSFSQVLEWVLLPLNGGGKVLMPLVTLGALLGPALLLLILNWDKVCVELRRLGPGVVAVVGLNLPLGLVTEPRYVILAWPLAVTALVLALQHFKVQSSFLRAFFILSILSAQFWLPMNLKPWTGGDYEGLLDFPKQFLFMHYGPWMSWPSYLVQLSIVILSGIWLRLSFHRDEKTPVIWQPVSVSGLFQMRSFIDGDWVYRPPTKKEFNEHTSWIGDPFD